MGNKIIALLLLLSPLAACNNLVPSPTPTMKPLESQGRMVFQSYCSSCHGTTDDTVIVGPSLAGISTRASQRINGLDAPAYIRQSIEDPRAYTLEGFTEGLMPANLKDHLTEEDLDALIAYLLTLK